MATREELIEALQQADEAGNTEDAQVIAEMIRDGSFDVPSLDEPFGEPEEPGFFERETGGLTGSIAGGIAGFQKTPGPWQVKVLGGAAGAFVGGFGGDVAQQEYQKAVDSPLAPKTFEEEMGRALKYGGESALYDLAGNGIFKLGSKVWQMAKPKGIDDIAEVEKVISNQTVSQKLYDANHKVYDRYGLKVGDTIPASLTAAQMTSNRMVGTIETLTESSWGGGAITRQREINDLAISEYTTKYIDNFNNTAGEILNDEGLGMLFINGIEAGKQMHKTMGGQLYSNLDELYKPLIKKVLVEKETPTGLLDAAGKMLGRKTTEIVEKEVLPVSTKLLKEFAKKELAKTAGTKHRALSGWSKKELEAILKFDKTISFAEAQAYRSKMIAESTGVAKRGEALGEGKSGALAKTIARISDDMIAKGALATKNPEFIAKWREANAFWKEGAENFSNKFISSLMKKDPSEIGKALFNSTPEQVRGAQASLRKAAKLDKSLDFHQTWLDMQQGYIQKIMSDTIDPKTGEVSIHQLSQWLKPHSDKNKKLISAFTTEQRSGLKSFSTSVEAMQKLPAGEGSFMVTVGQAGLVLGGLGSLGYQEWKGQDIAGDIALYTITPFVLSKLLLRPKWARTMSAVMRMKGRPKLGTAAAATIAKLIAAANEIELLGE
jgi:hypothetical protein